MTFLKNKILALGLFVLLLPQPSFSFNLIQSSQTMKLEIAKCNHIFQQRNSLLQKCRKKAIKKYQKLRTDSLREMNKETHKKKSYKRGIENQRRQYEKAFGTTYR